MSTAVGSWVTANIGSGCFTGKDHVVATGHSVTELSQVLLDTYV